MRIILIYDVSAERVNKVMKVCREYLEHVQNSVFEGDITDSNFKELTSKLKSIIDQNIDSIIIYHLWISKYNKEIIGIEKRNNDNFI